MKILFDTDVVLDVLLAREPYAGVAALLLALVDREVIDGAVCATTVTNVDYLATKALGRRRAVKLVSELVSLFAVAPVDRDTLTRALALGFDDFEDAVVHEAAAAWGAAGIVTRNLRDFAKAPLPVFGPDELLSALQAVEE